MWCLVCFQTPHHPRCKHAPAPVVAFYCDRCRDAVYEYELDESVCYVTPTHQLLCSTCVDTMSVIDALEYLGCSRMGYIVPERKEAAQ